MQNSQMYLVWQDTSLCHVHSSQFSQGHVSAYHLKVAQGGPHDAYMWCELMVPVTQSLSLIVIVRPPSHL
jgi:hypothetical protein